MKRRSRPAQPQGNMCGRVWRANNGLLYSAGLCFWGPGQTCVSIPLGHLTTGGQGVSEYLAPAARHVTVQRLLRGSCGPSADHRHPVAAN
jgi:hypothetical protein